MLMWQKMCPNSRLDMSGSFYTRNFKIFFQIQKLQKNLTLKCFKTIADKFK